MKTLLLCLSVYTFVILSQAKPNPQILFPGKTNVDSVQIKAQPTNDEPSGIDVDVAVGDREDVDNSDREDLDDEDLDDEDFEVEVSVHDRRVRPANEENDNSDDDLDENEGDEEDFDEDEKEEEDEDDLDDNVSITDKVDQPEELTTSDCLAIGNTLPARDPESGEMVCFDLATTGPCPEGQWFLLDLEVDENGDPKGVCKERKCPLNHVEFEGECRMEGSFGTCNAGQEILINPLGEGECSCVKGSVPYVNEEGEERCYHEYTKGPCEEGEQIIDISSNAQALEANPIGTDCIPHGCEEGELRWEDGECYEEPLCAAIEEVVYDEEIDDLGCGNLSLRQLLTLEQSCPDGQTLNSAGECKKVISLRGNERPRRRLATRNRGLKSFLKNRKRATN